jgi:hypothetical protein
MIELGFIDSVFIVLVISGAGFLSAADASPAIAVVFFRVPSIC